MKRSLKVILAERNIRSMEICRALNIHPSMFSLYLNGWRRLPSLIKEEIAEYLGISEEEIEDK